MKRIALVLLLVTIAGCATVKPPTEDEFAKADFGAPVSREQFDKLAQANLRELLVDPNSLIYHGSTPVEKYWASDRNGQLYYGYFGCYEYNAKNRMGGYGGKERQCLFVRNGNVVQMYAANWINNGKELVLSPRLNTIR